MSLLRRFEKTFVFLLKFVLCAMLFVIFFGIFGLEYFELLNISRTAGITMLTFFVLCFILMRIYGGFPIGVQKSKPIIHGMILATVFTDLVTHFQFCIMKASEQSFHYLSPYLLVAVIALQILFIYLFTYLGNYLYFKINPPVPACVIASSKSSLNEIVPKILKFKKQYKINDMIHYEDSRVFDVIKRNQIVFLCGLPMEEREKLIKYCYENNKDVNYNFELSDIIASGARQIMLDDTSLIAAYSRALTWEQRVLKKGMDLFISFMALIVTSPIMLACAVAIKLEDHGKVFFLQKRVTRNEEVFEMYKFRTMKEAQQINRSVTVNDERITKIGRFLRKYRLDELPQFLNVLKGEMSIVGPRPEMIENVKKYTEDLPEFKYRLKVKAGLTGYAQIYGKYNTSPRDKLVMDLMYIETYSIWQDVKLLFKTITVFLKPSESTEAFMAKEEVDFMQEEQKVSPAKDNADSKKVKIVAIPIDNHAEEFNTHPLDIRQSI